MADFVLSSNIHGKEYQVALSDLVWRPACYGIVIRDGSILLTKQHGSFHLPGGGAEFGEMMEDTVVREIQEETGIEAANPRLVKHISGFFTYEGPDATHHYQSILLYFVCDYVGGELSTAGFMEDEKEIGEMPEWIPLAELDGIKAGSTIDWRAVVKEVVGQ